MKTRCLIVDDEPLAIEVIENHISQFDNLEVAAKCRNAIKAFEVLEKEKIDLLFLDIQMPKLTGIDFLKSINNPPKVIFTTAYIDFALEGYELDVIDYLVKPISFQRFLKAINKYLEIAKPISNTAAKTKEGASNERDYLFVKADRKNHKVSFSEILYAESVKDYVKIHTVDKRLTTKNTMTDFEMQLPDNFLRVHRSYVINLDFITAYTANDIEIDSIEIPIGVSYKQKVFERLR